MEQRGMTSGFLSESRKLPEPSGEPEELGFSVGIMPCRGVPQTAQASAFNEISAPQQVQYAAKDQLQNFTLLDGTAGVKDSFLAPAESSDQVSKPFFLNSRWSKPEAFFIRANVIKSNKDATASAGVISGGAI